MFFLLFSPQLNYENVPVKSNRGDRDWKIITFSFKCGFACFERQGFYALIITLSGMVVLSRPQTIFIPAKLKFYNWLAAHNLSLVLDTVMTFFLGINRVRKMDNIP